MPESDVDFFYDLRQEPPGDSRSLLLHEEPGACTTAALEGFLFSVFLDRLRLVLERYHPKIMLDIGCGNGFYAEALSDLYDRYYGLEPSDVPPWRRLAQRPPQHAMLVHYDPSVGLPVMDHSVDLVSFIASYDHIPNRIDVLRESWRKLVPGGLLLIGMSNYGFWIKRLVNFIGRRRFFEHRDHHYCVHTPWTLVAEVAEAGLNATAIAVDADSIYVPNLPRFFAPLYRREWVIASLNTTLRRVIHSGLSLRCRGASMLVMFQKREESTLIGSHSRRVPRAA